MSTVIHKFPLKLQSEQQIEICTGAWILDLQVQNGVPALWAMVDDKDQKHKRDIIMLATGQKIECIGNLEYLGTAQVHSGLVFHFFQRVAF